MHIPNSEGHAHTMLGQKCAFATASLILGITSFIGLLGLEKAVLAIVFGWLSLKSLPGSAPMVRRGWARAAFAGQKAKTGAAFRGSARLHAVWPWIIAAAGMVVLIPVVLVVGFHLLTWGFGWPHVP